MKGVSIGKTSNAKAVKATDWTRLRRMDDAEIRKGIASDPDAHATDAEFWEECQGHIAGAQGNRYHAPGC
jgi:phage portal protein BeeE